MKERQKETVDALKMAGELEGKLDSANKRFVLDDCDWVANAK
jgi:hypothetical protein